jgi:hypothetical protein
LTSPFESGIIILQVLKRLAKALVLPDTGAYPHKEPTEGVVYGESLPTLLSVSPNSPSIRRQTLGGTLKRSFSCSLAEEYTFVDAEGKERVLGPGTPVDVLDGWHEGGFKEEHIVLHCIHRRDGEHWAAEVPWKSLIPVLT